MYKALKNTQSCSLSCSFRGDFIYLYIHVHVCAQNRDSIVQHIVHTCRVHV